MKPPKMDPRQNPPPEMEAGALAAYPKRRPLLPQIGVGVSSRGPRVRGPPYGASLYPNPLLHMDLPLLVWMTQLVLQRKVNFQIRVWIYLFVHIKNSFIGLLWHILATYFRFNFASTLVLIICMYIQRFSYLSFCDIFGCFNLCETEVYWFLLL